MAPAKRARASSPSGSSTAASAPDSKRARAVHSRVDCSLRPPLRHEEGAAPRQPLLALKRPPMKLHQERSAPPKIVVTKVDYSRPAAVSTEQLEAWRAARRQKLAERILRGRPASASSAPAAAASCLGVETERRTATSRPRAVASRLLQPRANRPQPERRRAQTEPPAAAPAPVRGRGRAASSSQASATVAGPAPAVAGIRMNKAAQRRLTMMQARRQQGEREAERRRTISGPLPKAAPRPAAPPRQRAASHRPGGSSQRPGASSQRPGGSSQRPGAPPRQTVAAQRSAVGRPGVSAPVGRRQTLTVGRRSGAGATAAGARRSTLGCVPSPRGARLSRQRLAELARPRAAAAAVKRSPPRASVARPVQWRPPAAASGVAERTSLTAMHRQRAALNPAAAIHRAAGHPQPPADSAETVAEVASAGGASVSRAPAATPGRQRTSSAAITGRGRPSSVMTPGHQRPCLPTLQQRLQQWLASRGKTLSSYRHLSCFGHEARTPARAPVTAASRRRTTAAAPKLEVDPGSPPLRARTVSPAPPVSGAGPEVAAPSLNAAESSSESGATPPTEGGGERMDNALTDLKELQDLGLPADLVVSWLERLSREPEAAGRARFWLCRATVAEKEGKLDAVLDCFREASQAKAEPVAELVSGLERFVHRATGGGGDDDDDDDDTENRPPSAAGGGTPRRSRRGDARTPRRPLLDHSNVFNSTVIKYAVVDDVPVLKKLATLREGAGNPVLSVITPVRRSTRRKSLRPAPNPHLVLFDSIEAISESLRQSAHFRRNSALISP